MFTSRSTPAMPSLAARPNLTTCADRADEPVEGSRLQLQAAACAGGRDEVTLAQRRPERLVRGRPQRYPGPEGRRVHADHADRAAAGGDLGTVERDHRAQAGNLPEPGELAAGQTAGRDDQQVRQDDLAERARLPHELACRPGPPADPRLARADPPSLVPATPVPPAPVPLAGAAARAAARPAAAASLRRPRLRGRLLLERPGGLAQARCEPGRCGAAFAGVCRASPTIAATPTAAIRRPFQVRPAPRPRQATDSAGKQTTASSGLRPGMVPPSGRFTGAAAL